MGLDHDKIAMDMFIALSKGNDIESAMNSLLAAIEREDGCTDGIAFSEESARLIIAKFYELILGNGPTPEAHPHGTVALEDPENIKLI